MIMRTYLPTSALRCMRIRHHYRRQVDASDTDNGASPSVPIPMPSDLSDQTASAEAVAAITLSPSATADPSNGPDSQRDNDKAKALITQSPPDRWWESGTLEYFNPHTRGGRVHLPNGTLYFDQYATLESGLRLVPGAKVAVQVHEPVPDRYRIISVNRPSAARV